MVRAERRCGELLKETKRSGERRSTAEGRPTKEASDHTTLSDLNISRDQSSRWQELAIAHPEDFGATARATIIEFSR